jgi:hypothetical protein
MSEPLHNRILCRAITTTHASDRVDEPGSGLDRPARINVEKVNIMRKEITRSKLIQVWFAAVGIVVAAGMAFGASVTVGTGTMLLALCLAPPAIVLLLWPAAQSRTVAEVLRDVERDA